MPGMLKDLAAAVCHFTGFDQLVDRLRTDRRPLILGYQRVVELFDGLATRTMRPMLVSMATLERHLDWVGRRYDFVSLDELGEFLETGSDCSRLAAVTFDVGYREVYENAFPLLRRKGIPAAVFVVTDAVGGAQPLLHDRLHLLVRRALESGGPWPARVARLPLRAKLRAPAPKALDRDAYDTTRQLIEQLSSDDLITLAWELEQDVKLSEDELYDIQPLTWPMLIEMSENGVTTGSYTRSGIRMTCASDVSVLDETRASRALLRRKLQVPIRHFAYPDGLWSAVAVDAVRDAGYSFAYTTCPHRDFDRPFLTIPRVSLWEGSSSDWQGRFSGSVMSCHARGVFEALPLHVLRRPCHAHPGS